MAIIQTGTTEEKLRYFQTLSESYKTLWQDEAQKREVNLIEIQMYMDQCKNYLSESNKQAAKIQHLNRTIGRLENDLSDGVRILETIWIAFDKDYLMQGLLSVDYEKLKDYLGK
jgi:hypothetical protein